MPTPTTISTKDATGVTQNLISSTRSGNHLPHRIAEYYHTTLSATPTVSTTPAYTAKDLVGGKMSFTTAALGAAEGGIIWNLVITDLGIQNAELDLILFDSDPSGTTFTDNAALDIADADITKIIGIIKVADYAEFNDNSVGQTTLRLAYKLASGTTLYGALVTRSTPTYTSTSDITVRLSASLG